MNTETKGGSLRSDLLAIANLIESNSRVLDVGCGNGELLSHLQRTKKVDARGMELSQTGVNACVAKGLSVVQGDADTDLIDYPSNAFGTVVLSQTLQATKDPKGVLTELMRIGQSIIVSFPNFGNWRVRLDLLFRGRMPVTSSLSESWYRTPNIHLCTVRDFLDLCETLNATLVEAYSLSTDGRIRPIHGSLKRANLVSEQVIFMIKGD